MAVRAIASSLFRLWPWLVASAAIHGLVMFPWEAWLPGADAKQASILSPVVTVELLDSVSEAVPLAASQVISKKSERADEPKQRPERPVQPVVQQTQVSQASAVDSKAKQLPLALESESVSAAQTGVSGQQAKSLVRQHLESFKYYPSSARRRGIEGEVDVAFRLAMRGQADEVSIVRGSGYAVLDRAALDTVQRAQPFPVEEGLYRFRLRFGRL